MKFFFLYYSQTFTLLAVHSTVRLSPGSEGYGINFRGSSPVTVDTVLPGSLAEKGGLKYGDFLVELNGNDIRSFTKEAVISAIKSSNQRGTLAIRVGRVRPIPMTPDDKKEAVKMIQQKVRIERCYSYLQKEVKSAVVKIYHIKNSLGCG